MQIKEWKLPELIKYHSKKLKPFIMSKFIHSAGQRTKWKKCDSLYKKKDLKTHIFDVRRGDGLAVHVDGSFCDDDDVKPWPGCTALEVNMH